MASLDQQPNPAECRCPRDARGRCGISSECPLHSQVKCGAEYWAEWRGHMLSCQLPKGHRYAHIDSGVQWGLERDRETPPADATKPAAKP